jgi:hypothetical protein
MEGGTKLDLALKRICKVAKLDVKFLKGFRQRIKKAASTSCASPPTTVSSEKIGRLQPSSWNRKSGEPSIHPNCG